MITQFKQYILLKCKEQNILSVIQGTMVLNYNKADSGLLLKSSKLSKCSLALEPNTHDELLSDGFLKIKIS